MTTVELEYPEQHLLWAGVMLSSISHAIFVARYLELAHEQSWDENNYCVQDSAGSRGTIAFSGKQFVAVFFSARSNRNPFKSDEAYDLQRFFDGLPNELAVLAHDEAVQYMLQDYKGDKLPIITSAFWGDGKQKHIAAAEKWNNVFENGAFLIKNQLLSQDKSFAAWQVEYGLSAEEGTLIKSLFERKIRHFESQIHLTTSERSLLQSIASNKENLDICYESFLEINIIM